MDLKAKEVLPFFLLLHRNKIHNMTLRKILELQTVKSLDSLTPNQRPSVVTKVFSSLSSTNFCFKAQGLALD